MIVWGFFVLIESSSEKCLANRWKTEDKRLYYVIKKGRVHYNSLKLVLGDSISFFLHKIPNSKWYTVCFAQLGGKPWKRKKVKNLYWQLLTDSTKCLSNLLIHSSFFLYWYGRSNSFPRKKNVSSESSTNLKGSSRMCSWKPWIFPWEMHRLVPSSAEPLGHPGVFLLFPGHWEVTPYKFGYKLTSFKIVLSRSIRGQDPAVGGTAYTLHPKIRIFHSHVKGGEGWPLCRQLGWWTEVHQGLWLADGAEMGTQPQPPLGQ